MLHLDKYSIHRTYERCTPFKNIVSMNLRFQMVDTDTGEILATSYNNYILNFHDKKDVGFRRCLEWCMSAVRGVRTTEHKNIELRVFFGEEKKPVPLFPDSHSDAAQNVLANVY